MFTVRALKDITIGSLDIMGAKWGYSFIRVYTKSGNYNGCSTNSGCWELIASRRVYLRQGSTSNVGMFWKELKVDASSEQSFYVFSSDMELEYTKGSSHGRTHYSNGSLQIKEGYGTKKWFSSITGVSKFAGALRYVILCFFFV